MTSRDPDELRDARVDAAWRAASREEPPPALDDAIRAAARRETGAGPHRIDPPRAAGPASLRPQRWWWPLAAAATIGAIAIGLLQLTEPERAGVAGDEKAVVSDMPPAPPGAGRQESGTPTPARGQAPASPPAVLAPTPPGQTTPAPAKPGARLTGTPATNESRSPQAPAAASALREDAAPVTLSRDERGAADAVAPPAVPEPRAATNAAAPASPFAQPFPADAPKREAKASKLDDAAPAAGAVAPSPAPAAQAEAPRDAQRSSEGVARRAPAADADADSAYRKSAEMAGVLQAQATKDRARTALPMSVPDWIAQIRRLRDEGRADDAARELAAFRRAHPDHEQLLPPDLRGWKPAGH